LPKLHRNKENIEQLHELVLSKRKARLTSDAKEKSLEGLAFQKLPCMKLSSFTGQRSEILKSESIVNAWEEIHHLFIDAAAVGQWHVHLEAVFLKLS